MKRTAFPARGDGLRRTPLRPGPPPKRRTPLRVVNAARRARLRAKQFGPHAAAVCCLPCAACRPEVYGFDGSSYFFRTDADLADLLAIADRGGLPVVSDPHHAIHTRGAGGLAHHVAPLCCAHHDEAGTAGRITFARRYRVRLRALARRLARVSPLLAQISGSGTAPLGHGDR